MFSDSDRAIFPLSLDGVKITYLDPLVLHRKLVQACGGDLYGLLAEAQGPKKDSEGKRLEPHDPMLELKRLNAQELLAEAARVAFDLPKLDPATGQGVPEALCWKALNSFMEWTEGEDKRESSSPT